MDFQYFGLHWSDNMKGRKYHPSFSYMYYDAINTIRVNSNEELELSMKYMPKTVTDYQGTVESTFAVATMRSQECFTEGYIEAEVKLPRGNNLWPAFWLTGDKTWPPEIDIFEAWSNNNGNYFRLTIPQPPYLVPGWKVTTNYHYKDLTVPDAQKQAIGSRNISLCKMFKSPDEYFHKYGVEFTNKTIKFFVDGKLIRKTDTYDKCIGPMSIIFDVWCQQYSPSCISPMIIKSLKVDCDE